MSVSSLHKQILQKNILVIGAGSIGVRHMTNLVSLGFKNVFVFRHKRSDNLVINGQKIVVVANWKEVGKLAIYATIICSPTSMHMTQAIRCLQVGSHLLIEKPLSDSKAGIERLRKEIGRNRKLVVVAYMLRYHPLLRKVKQIVENKTYGNLISFSSKWGEFLPDWHPWEDYRKSYAARKELGGGVALTLSHDIDIVNWITGSKVCQTKNVKNFRSKLKIDVESGCDIIYQYANGGTGHSHLDYYSKHHERYIEFIFDDANIRFDYLLASLTIITGRKEKVLKADKFERNELFIDELVAFFKKTTDFNIKDSIQAVDESEVILNICKKENWKNG
ncbi:MAG: Gfo/Idh/MocA family oxidoreductase [Chitinophagaceae bacterium]|nr:Gfo/Idh/MocA family oxidoreductase [Chitinophagaceae bacterium]